MIRGRIMKKIVIVKENGIKRIRFDRVCPECGGTGYSWPDGGQCERCGGLGEI